MNSENVVPNDTQQLKSKPTVDDIRQSLKKKLQTTKQIPISSPREIQSIQDPDDDLPSSSRTKKSAKMNDSAAPPPELFALSQEILTYCHLVDNSRLNSISEALGLRETVRELEKLLDSARQREIEHLSHVDQHREAINVFEKRYYSLKSRARTHIKECQDDRDRYRKESEGATTKLKAVEADLYLLQSQVQAQNEELERLRLQTKNMPSEKELTNMSLKLRRLEDENGRLGTERARLMTQIDELGGKGRSGAVLSTREESTSEAADQSKTRVIEEQLAKLRQELSAKEFALKDALTDGERYREWCEVLLEQIPKGTS